MARVFKVFKKKSLLLFSLVGIVLAVFLRTFKLNSIPVFADEAIYVRWSQIMRAEETLRFLPLTDGKQPLFMWLTIPFLKLISDPLIAGRMVSILSGLGSMVGIFVLAYLFFKSYRLSLVSSFIYAVLPFSVFFDRFALVDSLLSFFGLWAFIFAILTVQKKRLDTAMIAGFFLGGALLTKSPGIYVALLLPSVLVLSGWPKKIREKFNQLSVLVFLFAFTYAIGFAMQNILRLGPNFHMIALRNADYVYPISHIFGSPLDPLKPFLIRNFEYLWMLGTPFFVFLIILGIYRGLRKYPKQTILLLIIALVPIFISSEFSKTMTARYIFPSVPFFILLSVIPFTFLEKRKYLKIVKFAIVLFVATVVVKSYMLITRPQLAKLPRSERSGYLEDWTSGFGIREISQYLKKEYISNPSQKIVVGTEGYFGTLPDGLQMYLNGVPEITVIGIGQPVRVIPQSLQASRTAGNKTYIVVNDTRFLIDNKDFKDLGINAVSVFPKAVKPDGSQENLLFLEITEP